MIAEKALNLKADESKVSNQEGKETDPDEEAIASHVLVVVVKVGKNGLSYVPSFAEVDLQKISSVVCHKSEDKGDPNGGDVASSEGNNRKNKNDASNHAIDKTQNSHIEADGLPLRQRISFFLLINNDLFFPHLIFQNQVIISQRRKR